MSETAATAPGENDPGQTIQLIEPADGSVTVPLQKHELPEDDPGGGDTATASNFRWDDLHVVSADRSVPRPVTFSWQKLARSWRHTTYQLTISRAEDFSHSPFVLRDLSRHTVDVWHLFIGTRYFWKITAQRAGGLVATSPVWQFTTNSTPPRWIKVPGITNVRDLGGWPLPGNRRIRQGMVYRSSEMNGNLEITARGKSIIENDLHIRTDLDLRGEYEGASPALDTDKVQWIHAPVSPYDCISDAAFRDEYRKIFKVFTDRANYPVLFHCVGGADRGGTVAFLLNALLGKDLEHLLRDYELTTLSVWGERSRWSEQFGGLLEALRPFDNDPDDVHRQVENYLLSIGLTKAELKAIRDLLIADSPST